MIVTATGTTTLAGGTATVATPAVRSDSVVIVTRKTAGGTLGFLTVGAITPGTSFVINSANPLDVSEVFWVIFG